MKKSLALAAATILSLSACGGAAEAEPVAPPAPATTTSESTPNLAALVIDVPDLPGENFAGYTRNRETEARWAANTTPDVPMCEAAGPRPQAKQRSGSRVFNGYALRPWVGIRVNDYGTSDEASKALEWNRGAVTACPDYDGETRTAVVSPEGHPDYVVIKSLTKSAKGDEDRRSFIAQRGRFIIVAFNTPPAGWPNSASMQLTKAVEVQSAKLDASA